MNAGSGELGMKDVVEPAPFEVRGADGLGFVTGDENGDRATAKFLEPFCEAGDQEGFDGCEVLAFVDRDAIPGELFGGKVWKLLDSGPGEVEVGEESGGDRANGLFEARSDGVGYLSGGDAGEAGADGKIVGVVTALNVGSGEAAEASGKGTADDVGMKFVEEGGDVLGPGTEIAGEGSDLDAKAAALFGEWNGRGGDVEECAEEVGKSCDVVLAGVGAVAIKVRTGESREVGRISEIEDVTGGGLIGGMKEGGGFA